MSWAELFERAAAYGVTEAQISDQLARRRDRRTTRGEGEADDR